MSIWTHASQQNPCPICLKSDWCTFGERAMLCQRVESLHPFAKGGWFHFYDNDKPEFVPKRKENTAPPRSINASEMVFKWRQETQVFQYHILAESLGVLPEALIGLGAAYAKEKCAWAFPMKDANGDTCGIRLRNAAGFKWAVTGSKQGIFVPLPSVLLPEPKIAYLPEGPTDTAALLSLGLYAIGRPNNNGGADEIRATLQRLKIFRAVIVADNDELKRIGDKDERPGMTGALRLKKQLGISSVIYVPLCKDIRAQVKLGGTKEMIEADIKNRMWSK